MPEFVVQEHRADRAGLHYDLRLEVGGALESWAIPKGVPPTTGVRRLAIEMPVHPLDYKDFEGVVEKGYGKGDVSIWDSGEYISITETPDLRLIQLRGDRLRGNYYLRRTKGRKWLIWKRA